MSDWYISPLKTLFPAIQWSGPGPSVCLTFDDGPHPVATPAVLEILRARHITATFFLLGKHVERYPEIVQDIVREGHVIGNHTQTHSRVWFTRRRQLEEEIGACQKALRLAAGVESRIFRPPYGLFDPSTARSVARMGLRTVLFSVNSWDFAEGSHERIVQRATRSAQAGDIIVLHDNEGTASRLPGYLPRIISVLTDKGLSFGPV